MTGPTVVAASSGGAGGGRSDGVGQRVDETMATVDHDDPPGRGAFLPGVAGRGPGDDRRGERRVGVGEHDGRVVAAHLALDGDPSPRRIDRDTPPHRGRTGEGHDVGLLHQRTPGCGRTVGHTQRAGRQAGAEDLGEESRTRRGVRRGFDDHRVAGGQRRSRLPQRDGQREVPGGDEPGDAVGASPAQQQAAGGGGQHITGGRKARLGVEVQDRNSPCHLTRRLAHRLADFLDHQADRLVAPAAKPCSRSRQCCGPAGRPECPPLPLGVPSALDERCHAARRRGGEFAHHLGGILRRVRDHRVGHGHRMPSARALSVSSRTVASCSGARALRGGRHAPPARPTTSIDNLMA